MKEPLVALALCLGRESWRLTNSPTHTIRKRNEALDLRVYSYAAFVSLNAGLHRIAERDQAALVGGVGNDLATPRSASPRRRYPWPIIRRRIRKNADYGYFKSFNLLDLV